MVVICVELDVSNGRVGTYLFNFGDTTDGFRVSIFSNAIVKKFNCVWLCVWFTTELGITDVYCM